VGFVHGVLNTDNMSIMGLTIDYGPFAFEEHFDPDFTPNGSDGGGRYTYALQPSMCKWNLKKLSEQLAPLLPISHSTEILHTTWESSYTETYSSLMHQKFGLTTIQTGDDELIAEYFKALATTRTDFTDSFRALTDYAKDITWEETLLENLVSRAASPTETIARRKMKIHRLGMQPGQIQQLWDMILKNPAEVSDMFGGAPIEAIKAEIEGEKRNLDRQSQATRDINTLTGLSPMQKVNEDRAVWAAWLKKYHSRLSLDGGNIEDKNRRIQGMRGTNPTFVLRNWIAQDAIEAAEKGSYEEVRSKPVLHCNVHDDLQANILL
jgi:serine/tyrosine/threonine adenylyltransferase